MSAEAAPADPATAAASLLETLREPAFRDLMAVAVGDNANARALFIELPLAAAVLTGKMMGMTQDRPPEQRFKPIMTRLRVLSEAEIAEVRVFQLSLLISTSSITLVVTVLFQFSPA